MIVKVCKGHLDNPYNPSTIPATFASWLYGLEGTAHHGSCIFCRDPDKAKNLSLRDRAGFTIRRHRSFLQSASITTACCVYYLAVVLYVCPTFDEWCANYIKSKIFFYTTLTPAIIIGYYASNYAIDKIANWISEKTYTLSE